MKKRFVIAVFFILLLCVSCTSTQRVEKNIGRFSIISTKNVSFKDLAEFQIGKKTTGKYANVTGTFLSQKGDTTVRDMDDYWMESTIDAALEEIPGAVALIDAKLIEYYSKTKGFLNSQEEAGFSITGTVLIDPSRIEMDSISQKDCYKDGDEILVMLSDGGVEITKLN